MASLMRRAFASPALRAAVMRTATDRSAGCSKTFHAAHCRKLSTMDTMESGTKMYMSLYPEDSTDGGKEDGLTLEEHFFCDFLFSGMLLNGSFLLIRIFPLPTSLKASALETLFPTFPLRPRMARGRAFTSGRRVSGRFCSAIPQTSHRFAPLKSEGLPLNTTSWRRWTV